LIGSQGLKSADAARNTLPLQRSALPGLRGSSDGKAGETQLLSFPQRDVFQPAPQPAVGAKQPASHRYPALAANDAAGAKRRGRYNWDGRYIGKAAPGDDSPSVARRVLVPVAGLALLAGVALGAFYFMHSFAVAPGGTPVAAAKEQPSVVTAAAPLAPAAAKAAPNADTRQVASQAVAERVASPDKTEAISSHAVAAANMKVPAPDNARWGDAADGKPDPAPATQANAPASQAATDQADAAPQAAAPEVKDPQSAPVPTEAPRKLAYAAPEPKPAHDAVDKAATASLPPAKPVKGTPPPGVDPNLLSVPSKASAGAADESASGGYLSAVKSGVRMHSGAGNHTGVVGVVPDNATVRVLSCNGWCRISYNGKQGYIFKSFLGGAAAAQAEPAPAQPASAPEPQEKTAAAAGATTGSDGALKAAAEQTMSRGR
jgi:hypothetical protein